MKLIDPTLGLKLVVVGGWTLAAIGALKLVIYLIGEIAPGSYDRIRSETFRKFLTGKGNRLVFGLGGILTVFVGLVFVLLGRLLSRLDRFY